MLPSTENVFGGKRPKIRLNFVPHDGQNEVLGAILENSRSEEPASIFKITCGRSWGKTAFICGGILVPYVISSPNAKIMWVAPYSSITLSPIEDFFRAQNEILGEPFFPEFDDEGNRVWEFVTTKLGPQLTFWNGATVTMKSANNPDSIVSRGYNLIIMDEACLIDELAFTQQIMGTARKGNIKVIMISTPRGKRHWTYKIFLKGQDPTEKMYLSFQQPYTKNPYFNKTLAKMIVDLPDWLFRQEYLAEYIEDGDSVFKGLEQVLFGDDVSFPSANQEWEMPQSSTTVKTVDGDKTREFKERTFIVSLDLAKSVDFSVFWVMDTETGECVYYKRVNKTDYRDIVQMAADVCKKYNHADLIFDATGVGSAISDMLNNYDVTAIPFVFTNESKNDIVNKLVMSIEYGEIRVPNINTVRKELYAFTYTMTKTQKISYGAPSGMHDDIVMSLALANFYRKDNIGSSEARVIDRILDHNEASARTARKGSFFEFMDNDND